MTLQLPLRFRPLAIVGLAALAGWSAPTAGAANRPAAPATGEIPVGYWTLATGSRIAYVHAPARGPICRGTLVFLHGGPGAAEVHAWTFARAWFERLARAGFDLYLYDQVGGGRSARLADPRHYTLARHVADLEGIRRLVGSDRLILIGESWGATLAAHYFAAHRDRVARIAFVSPGALEPSDRRAEIYPYPSPRIVPELLDWIGRRHGPAVRNRCVELNRLLERDIPAAHAFAGDAEMDALWETYIREAILPTCVHRPVSLQQDGHDFAIPGVGWWASLMTSWDAVRRDRAVRARLAGHRLPALILRGESDYLPPDYAADYAAAFPEARMVNVPGAGHLIWLEHPEIYREEIERFLVPGGLPATASAATVPP